MTIVDKEVRKSLTRNKTLTILIIIQFTIAFMVINTVFNNIAFMNKSKDRYTQHLRDKCYYHIIDSLENVSDVLNGGAPLVNLKSFYEVLADGPGYTYLEAIIQPVYVADFNGDNIHLYGYEDGLWEADTSINGVYHSYVKGMMINENSQVEYRLQVSLGRTFKQPDFVMSEEPISVLMGSTYQDFYQVGDIIAINHLNKSLRAEVIGFLAEDEAILVRGHMEYLDRYIVIPAVTCPAEPLTKEDQVFQGINYLHKVNGTISINPDNTIANFISYLDDIRRQHNVFAFNVLSVSNLEIALLRIASGRTLSIMTWLGWIMIFFSVLTLSISLVTKVMSNRYNYAVHILCGGTSNNIKMYIVAEAIFITLTAHLFASLLTLLLFSRVYTYRLFLVLLSAVIVALATIYPLIVQAKQDLSYSLGGKE